MATDSQAPDKREKVALRPGFHLTDWLRFHEKRQPSVRILTPITREELAAHRSEHDCWTCINGHVYDISHYIPYHPGGNKIKLGAGKDCTALFNKYHSWVNADQILKKCLIGRLADEEKPDTIAENKKEDEDEGRKSPSLLSFFLHK